MTLIHSRLAGTPAHVRVSRRDSPCQPRAARRLKGKGAPGFTHPLRITLKGYPKHEENNYKGAQLAPP
jgi:hypothetical protein